MITKILENLPPDKMKELRIAFDDLHPFRLDLDDGYFVGVHLGKQTGLNILEQKGQWYYGRN